MSDLLLAIDFCCMLIVPLVLQTIGLFTPEWVTHSNSTCKSAGLIYSCCYGNDSHTCKNTEGSNEYDERALGLEATSFALLFLSFIGTCCGLCRCCRFCCKNDKNNDRERDFSFLYLTCFIVVPLAGLLSVVGCSIASPDSEGDVLGYSGILCFCAGIIAMSLPIGTCCWVWIFGGNHEDDTALTPLIHEGNSRHGTIREFVGFLDQRTGSLVVAMRHTEIKR